MVNDGDGPPDKPVAVLRREPGLRAALSAIVRGRCPRCRQGRIFARLFGMTRHCAVCGLRFEREPGYFTGAMYVSYVLALPIFVALFTLTWQIAPELPFETAIAITALLFLPFVPLVFRYSRILWIHIDRTIDAGGP